LAKRARAGTFPGERKLLKSFGRRVAALRERKALSVYDLTGDDMPIKSRQHWQAIEAGRKHVNLTTVFKVAHCLGVRPEELVAGLEAL
jgi:transcriptional regulator with XRE-family HTH domain